VIALFKCFDVEERPFGIVWWEEEYEELECDLRGCWIAEEVRDNNGLVFLYREALLGDS